MRFKTRLFVILSSAGLAGVFSFLLVDLSALVASLPLPAWTEIPTFTPAIKLLSLIQPAMLVALAVLGPPLTKESERIYDLSVKCLNRSRTEAENSIEAEMVRI